MGNIAGWKKVFRKDFKTKVEHAQKEYNKYKSTNQVIYLQQSCGKLFSAVENYLMVKYGKRQRSYGSIVSMVSNNEADRTLLNDAVQLHYFYYNGEAHFLSGVAEKLYKIVRKKMLNRIKR